MAPSEPEETETKLLPPLLKVEEAAKLARVSRSSIWRRIRRGEISAVRVGNETGPLRVPTQSFLSWLYGGAPSRDSARLVTPAELESWATEIPVTVSLGFEEDS